MSEVTIEPGPDDTPTVVPLGAQSASVVSTDGQVVIGGLDATGVDEGYVPTADGADGWAWAAAGGGEIPDTGVRDVTGLLNTDAFYSGWGEVIRLWRRDALVTLEVTGIYPSVTSTFLPVLTLPEGFRPISYELQRPFMMGGDLVWTTLRGSDAGPTRGRVAVTHTSSLLEQNLSFEVSFATNDPWPTTLPGTPA